MEMTSSYVPSEQPQRALQARAINYMDKDLFKAAATGDMELFNKYQGDFQCLVDGRKNTALHIYFSNGLGKEYKIRSLSFWRAGRFKREMNINFIRELVGKCPSLLLQPNEKGEIPLHIVAAKVGSLEVVKLITERTKILQNEDLEMGLEATNLIKERLRMRDEDGNTALHRAAESGEADVVGLLAKELDADDISFSPKNKRGETPLHMAARVGNHHSVAEILDNCKSTAHGGPNGTTALHAAIFGRRSDERTVRKLIEAKKQLIRETDDEGRTPLHYAAHVGDRSAVKQMLEADAYAAYIKDDGRGMTALHMAAWQGHKDIMEDIISYCPGCCGIVEKKYGWNFVHFAAFTLDVIRFSSLLFGAESKIKDLSSGNFFFQKDVNGNTPYDIKLFRECNPSAAGVVAFYSRQAIPRILRARLLRQGNEESKYYMKAEKQKQIVETLKEIGNNAEVAGLPVHHYFREVTEDNLRDVGETVGKLRESHLVVATLVATVTFTAGIAVPGGYKSDNTGSATLSHNSAFKAFIITDTLAFLSSLSAIFIYFLSPLIGKSALEFSIRWLTAADNLALFAIGATVVAFSTGTYAVLESSMGLAIATCSISLTLLPISIIARSIFNIYLYPSSL